MTESKHTHTPQPADFEVYLTEDLQPWALFVIGRYDPAQLKSEPTFELAVAAAQIGYGLDYLDARALLLSTDPAAHHLYNRHTAEETSDPDFPWAFCDAGAPDAVAITGWRFVSPALSKAEARNG